MKILFRLNKFMIPRAFNFFTTNIPMKCNKNLQENVFLGLREQITALTQVRVPTWPDGFFNDVP